MAGPLSFDAVFGAVEPKLSGFIQSQKKAIAKVEKKKQQQEERDKAAAEAAKPDTAKVNGHKSSSGQAKSLPKPMKPFSKTAVGQFTYQLKKLPALWVAQVKVLSKQDAKEGSKITTAWDDVASRRLREKALSELVDKLGLKAGKNIIIDTKHGLGGNLIISPDWLSQSEKHSLTLGSVDLVEPKRGETQDTIRCDIVELVKFSGSETNDDFYVKNLEVFIQSMQGGSHLAAPHINDDQIKPSMFDVSKGNQNGEHPTKENVQYPLRIRNNVSIDAKAKVLKMNFELVPCTPSSSKDISLRNIIEDVFGQYITDDNASQYLHILKQFLVGTEVERNYATLNNNAGPFKIVDVKMPDSVPKITCRNGKTYTVAEYFEHEVAYAGGKLKLDHPLFPLVLQGTDCWLPMEVLRPVKIQPLHRFDALVPKLLTCVGLFSKTSVDGKMQLDQGKSVLEAQAGAFFEELTNTAAGEVKTEVCDDLCVESREALTMAQGTKVAFLEVVDDGHFVPVDLVELAWL